MRNSARTKDTERLRGGPGLGLLSDELLINAYEKAVQLKLEQDFIELLLMEMKKRNLKISAPMNQVS